MHLNSVVFIPEMIMGIQLIYSGVKKHDSTILSLILLFETECIYAPDACCTSLKCIINFFFAGVNQGF